MNQVQCNKLSPQNLKKKSSKAGPPYNQQLKIKKTFKFYLGSRQRYIVFSSDFDSGNIQCVKQLSQFQYRLGSVPDNYGTQYNCNSKSWFYFSVTGFPNNTKGRFYIQKVQTLISIYQSKYQNSYRPVYKIGQNGAWCRLSTEANLVLRENDILEVYFDYLFRKQTDIVYFAFCYPFSYTQNLKYIQSLGQNIYNDDFYYHQQVLILSPQKRFIHLLTITSYDQKNNQKPYEEIFDEKLFPERNRPLRFNKPVILITARVHPGETPASHALKGVVNFLLNKNDLRAFILRKMFVFMIIPMINVDGVYNGHFRMDTYGQNLNRHYINPQFQKQPAVYGIKKLAEYLNKDKRLTFYFDLHAHNAKKGCFIYGNAINDFVDQVQSQVFCKLFSMNTKSFEYQYCNFSLKHMKAKDRFQNLTKQGCGRVVMHKLTGIIHSYSLQCGLISSNTLNILADPINTDFKVGQMGFILDNIEDNNNKIYKGDQPPLYTPQMYQNVGKALLISVLDTFDKNPYSRVYLSQHKNMQTLRRATAFQVFHQAQRFRMFERFTFSKVKNINELMQDNFKVKFNYKKIFNLNDNPILQNVEWPINIIGLKKQQYLKSNNALQKRQFTKKQENLYTQVEPEDNQNQLYQDILIKIKQVELKKKNEQENQMVESTQIPSPGIFQNRKRDFSAIKPRMIYEQSQNQQQESKRQQSLSVRVRKLFKNQMRKQLQDTVKCQIKQESSNVSVEIKKKQNKNQYCFGSQSQDFSPKFIQKRNTTALHSKLTKKNLPNLTIQNSSSVRPSIIINNIIVQNQQKKHSQYPTRRDLRIQIQKKKTFKQRKQQNNDKKQQNKLQIFEQSSVSKMMYASKGKLTNNNIQMSSPENRSKQIHSQHQNRSTNREKNKTNQISSAKLIDLKRSNSKFPDIIYQGSTNGTFAIELQTKPELNDLLKNSLKYEALKINAGRHTSGSRN